MKNVLLLVLATVVISSCTKKAYYSPQAFELAKKHNQIAIVPPNVTIPASKKMSQEEKLDQEYAESMSFQKEMYSWMLKRKQKNALRQKIQNVEDTRVMLERAQTDQGLTVKEMCNTLDVDGLITSDIRLSKPMSTGAAIALGVLAGAWGSTNEVGANVSIIDCSSNEAIYNYEDKYSGSVGSSPQRLMDAIMNGATKQMPYFKKKKK